MRSSSAISPTPARSCAPRWGCRRRRPRPRLRRRRCIEGGAIAINSGRVLQITQALTGDLGTGNVRPMPQFQLAVTPLDQRRAGIDPVSGVAVENPIPIADLGSVDMSADDPIETAFARRVRRGLL